MGNRITTVINGVTTAYTTNNMNEYTSVGGVELHVRCRRQPDSPTGPTRIRYNSLNQLIERDRAERDDDLYLRRSRRAGRFGTHPGMTTQYLIDPAGLSNVIGSYDGSGTPIANYVYGLGLTIQAMPSGTKYYEFDALGSTVALTNASGADVNQYSYLPFGGAVVE